MALYHSARGSVGYTIVGSPTIVDGVASGFSGSSYVQSSSTFPGSTATSLEFATKFNISSFASTSTIASSTSSTIPFHLAVRDSKFRLYPGIESTYKVGDFVLSENTDYFIKLIWDSTNGWKLQYSTDGTNYTTDFENYNPSNSAPKDNYIVLGRNYPNGGQEGLLGTLDLKNTYIIVNGQPWFGICPIEVKKHQLKGPVGYTVVGTPTITDGVASGFSSSDYFKFSSILSDITQTDVEILITLNNAGDGSAQGYGTVMSLNCLTIALTNNGNPTFTVYTQKAGETEYTGRTIYHWAISTQPGKFVIKFTKQSNLLSIQGSRNGETFTTASTYTLEEGEEISLPSAVGEMMKADRWTPLGTQLDLNNTYIKVNGKLWFWQPQETKYIQRNNQLVFADQGLYLSGPVNYTKVGSPTIVDGVVSGFSKNNYLSLGNFPQNVTDLEIQIKFKTGSASDVDVWQGLFSINASESGHNVYIRYNRNTRKISFSPNFLYSNENFILYSNALEYETWYTYKISKVGNVYTLYKNGVAEATATSNLAIEPNNLETRLGFVRIYTGSTVGGFNSSIDLNHTYIKVNNELWFYGKNYATKSIAPVPAGYPLTVKGPANYTVVGSPTITDGVISNMDGNNYVKMSSMPPFGNKDFEIKVVVNANVKKSMRIISNNVTNATMTSIVVTNTSGAIKGSFYDGTNKYDVTAPSAGNLVVGSKFYIIFYRNGTTLGIKTSADNTNWNEATTTIPSTSSFANNGSVFSLSAVSQGVPFDGSIYLDETYIKINVQPWFGKAYPVPATGYVEIPTQVFTAAPEGAVVGRDE